MLIKALEAIPFTDILSDQHINTPNGFVRRDHLVRWLKEWKRYFASPCHEQVMADLRMRVWKEKVNYDE